MLKTATMANPSPGVCTILTVMDDHPNVAGEERGPGLA